jgi:MFS superfamily sulfate permease-like transporter
MGRIKNQGSTAVFVVPPCCVTLGRHFIFTAPHVNESSLALLDQTYAWPVPRLLIFSAVNSPRAALAFCASCVAIILSCRRWLPRIPGQIVALVGAILVVYFLKLDQVGVAVVGDIPQGLPRFQIRS